MKRFTPLPGLILFFSLLLVACASVAPGGANATEGPQETDQVVETPIQIKLGYQPFMSAAPFYIAVEEGYFLNEGLDVELVSFSAAQQMLPALANGELDAAGVAVIAGTLNLAAQSDIRFVAERAFVDPQGTCVEQALVARNQLLENGFLDDPANVSGLQVSLTKGTVFEYAMDLKLRRLGLTEDDIVLVEILTQPAKLEALGTGAADLVTFPEPWITYAERSGAAGVWAPFQELTPNAPLSAILFSSRLMGEEDLGRRFMLGYLKAVQQYNEGKTDRNVEIIAQYANMDPEDVRAACWPAVPADGNIHLDAWMEYQDWLVEKDYLDGIVPPEQFWDSRYIDYANGLIGE